MKAIANRDPYKIGLVAVGLLVLLAVFVTVISTVSFGEKTYTAHISHTAGLRAGESVEIAGVSVGQVKSIELGPDDVEVTFTVKSDIRLGEDTTAAVKVATLLGTHYFSVDPQGSGSLSDDSIPLSRTQVPYNLQDVIDGGTEALGKLDAPLLAKALTVMADTAEGSAEEIGPALEGISRISTVITRRSSQAGELLEAARAVSDQLSDSTDDIFGLMRSTSAVLDEIQSRRQAISTLLTRASALADALNSVVTDTQGDLDVALRDVRTVLASLKNQDETLRRALTVLAPSVRYIANITGNGPWASTTTNSLIPDPIACNGQGTC